MTYGLFQRGCTFLPVLAMALAAPVHAVTSVTLSPGTLSFGKQPEGTTSAAMTATLHNVATATLTITGITVTGNFAQSGGTCPLSPTKLAKGASCTILITFTPQALGGLKGTLTVTDNASNSPQTASLTGSGSAPVTLSPTSLTFPSEPLGETSGAMTVTLTNQQNVQLNFSSVQTSGDFTVASNTCTGSIASLGTCTVAVTFSPTAKGARTGKLTFSDSAAGSPQNVSLIRDRQGGGFGIDRHHPVEPNHLRGWYGPAYSYRHLQQQHDARTYRPASPGPPLRRVSPR